MKRSVLFLFAIIATLFMSCSKTEPQEAPRKLTADEQKLKLEHVTDELIAHHSAEQFAPIFDLYDQFKTKYFPNYSWGNFEDLYLKVLLEELLDSNNSYYKHTFVLSNLKGNLDLTGDHAVYTDGTSDLTCSFVIDGVTYHATFVPDGTYTLKHVVKRKKHIPSSGNCKVITNDIYVEFPESMMITLKKGNDDFFSVNLKLDTSISPEGIDCNKDKFNASATISLPNGYEMTVDSFQLDMEQKKGNISCTIVKDKKEIISFSSDASVKALLYEKDCNCGFGHKETAFKIQEAKDYYSELSLLGEIQIKGTSEDIKVLSDIIDAANNLSLVPASVKAFNAKTDFSVYYDKNDLKQAELKFEEYKDTPESSPQAYPVLRFSDGSQFMIYDLYSEEDMDALDRFIQGFSNLISILLH